jgi:hypothetical protein
MGFCGSVCYSDGKLTVATAGMKQFMDILLILLHSYIKFQDQILSPKSRTLRNQFSHLVNKSILFNTFS